MEIGECFSDFCLRMLFYWKTVVQLECVEWYCNRLVSEGFKALEERYLSHHRGSSLCQHFVFT